MVKPPLRGFKWLSRRFAALNAFGGGDDDVMSRMDALVEETRNGRDALVASAHAGRCMDYQGWGRGIKPPLRGFKPKCRSWILVFSHKERKDRKAYRDGGLLLDFQAHPLF